MLRVPPTQNLLNVDLTVGIRLEYKIPTLIKVVLMEYVKKVKTAKELLIEKAFALNWTR